MSVWRSFLFGLGRVLKTPSLLCWVYLASLAVALPLAMVVRGGIAAHVGGSLVEQNLRTGLDLDWYGEFAEEASGVAATFGPEVIGHMALVQNLERLLDGKLLAAHRTLLAAGGLYLLFWTFLVGGILDRFAHPGEPHSRARLFGHSGEFFWRMFRLLILSVLFYLAIFRFVANPLHEFVEQATRDVTVERTVLLWTALVYLLTGLLLAGVSMAFDYAKIAVVVERRRSAVLALLRGLGFIARHPGHTCGLYLLLLTAAAVVMFFYGAIAPGSGQSNWATVLVAFVIGQAYVLARILVKLWFLASQAILFQAAANHPDRTAPAAASAPLP
ncbi:MAG: hypothetical protein K6U09_03550 [Acidobacteriia bacterium]|jgi:hypothetical protein|nr:hypothetical protein [Terriglobia bacterium]